MNRFNSHLVPLLVAIIAMPCVAAAQTVSAFLGLLNVVAGVMVVAALLAFIGGFIRYLVLLGTDRRDMGLKLMLWGVTILFVLVIILGIVNILQGPISFIIGIGVIVFLAVVIAVAVTKSGSKPAAPEEH